MLNVINDSWASQYQMLYQCTPQSRCTYVGPPDKENLRMDLYSVNEQGVFGSSAWLYSEQ